MRPTDLPNDDDPLAGTLHRYLLSGDEEALEEVVHATRARLLGAARRIGAPQDAEDAVQSAYLSLVRHRGSALQAPVLPWLLTAVIRIAYRRKALQQRELPIAQRLAIPATGVTPVVEVATREEEARLRREVLRLPDKYRDPVVLHYLQGLTQGETARLLEVPEPTVRTRLHRARLLLKTRLSPRLVHGFTFLPWTAVDWLRSSWTSSPLATASGLAVAGLLAGIGAAGLLVPLPGVADGERIPEEVPAARDATAASRRTALLRERTALRERLEQLLARTRETGERTTGWSAAAEAARAEATADRDDATDPRHGRTGALFSVGPHAAQLDEVAWDRLGNTMLELVKTIAAMNLRVLEGADYTDPDLGRLLGRTQELNGPLITIAMELQQAMDRARGGEHPHRELLAGNSAFTHPGFMANAMALTLASAGVALDEDQEAALRGLAAAWSEKETRRLEGYDASTWRLRALLEEADLREGFYDDARRLLTAAQREVLWPPHTAGRVQDLFSSGVVFNIGVIDTFGVEDRDDAIAKYTRWLLTVLDLPMERSDAAREVVVRWFDALPASFLEYEPDLLDRNEIVTRSRAHEAAEHALDLLEEAIADPVAAGCSGQARRVRSIPLPLGKVIR